MAGRYRASVNSSTLPESSYSSTSHFLPQSHEKLVRQPSEPGSDPGSPEEAPVYDTEVTSLREDESKRLRLLRATGQFRKNWDRAMLVLALGTCICVPYYIAFHPGNLADFSIAVMVFDIVWAIDIVFNFFTTYFDSNEEEIFNHWKIVKNYLTGEFAMDVIATFPIYNLAIFVDPGLPHGELLLVCMMLRLARVLRIGRMLRYARLHEDIKGILKLVVFTLYIVLAVHIFASTWWYITKLNENWIPVPDFLHEETHIFGSSLWKQYTELYYHGVWLLVGGEVGARTILQAYSASVMMIIGTVIAELLKGEMSVLMEHLNRRLTEFETLLDETISTCEHLKLPIELTNRIVKYLFATQRQLSAQEEYETFRKYISPSLMNEVRASIYLPIISKNPVFHKESQLTQFFIQKLENLFSKPEEGIITEGTQADAMYFIVNGSCLVTVKDENKVKHEVCGLYPGSHFGEIGLIYNIPRTATVTSAGYCTIASLSKHDFQHIINLYPTLIKRFKKFAEAYADPWKAFLLSVLDQMSCFRSLHDETFNELPFLMEVTQIEKNAYLFKPGEKATAMYLLADGQMELSVTINEKHLHYLKRKNGDKDIESSPRIMRKKEIPEYYKDYSFNFNFLKTLKKRAAIVPYSSKLGVIGCAGLGEEVPEYTQSIGDYPQEIVIAELGKGTLLLPFTAILRDTIQVQCKALRSSKVYMLRMDIIDDLAREFKPFGQEILKAKDYLHILLANSQDPVKLSPIADYLVLGEQFSIKKVWQQAILKVLFHNRENMKKGENLILYMLPKLKAFVACENAGNFDLAAKVANDIIPPHYISKDGTLDPNALKTSTNVSALLPQSHPIITAFQHYCDAVSTPEGAVVKEHEHLQTAVAEEARLLNGVRTELKGMRGAMLSMLRKMDDRRRPAEPGSDLERIRVELDEVYQREEERERNKKKSKVRDV